jgi:hypothetical protein
MLGNLYDRALDGERCWVRHEDGRVDRLPVRSWLGGRNADELLRHGGRCVAEFDSAIEGIHTGWVRLESSRRIGPWFRWASVGIDCATRMADDAGLAVAAVHPIGRRVVASLAAT